MTVKEISFLDNVRKTIHAMKIIFATSKRFLYVIVLQSIFTSIFPYIAIFFTYLIIDGIVDGIPKSDILTYVYLMIGISLFVGIARNYLHYLNQIYSVDLNYHLDSQVASKTFELDYTTVEDNEIMKMIEMAEEGCRSNGGFKFYCEYVISGILSSILSIMYGSFLLIGLVVVKDTNNTSLMVRILNSPWSVVVVILGLLIPFIISKQIMKMNNKKSYDTMMYNIEANRRSGYFHQICHNYKYGKDIRLFHLQDMFLSMMKELRKSADLHWRDTCIFYTKMMALTILGNKSLALIAYLFVGLKAMYGLITVGNVVAYVAAITLLSLAINNMIERYSRLHLFNNYLDNYFKYLQLESKKEYGSINHIDLENLSISFKNVSFKYPGQESYALQNINLNLRKGLKLAIVGLNGAGKTTLIKLLCRLYEPTEGEILINDIPITEYSEEICNTLFSVVFQDFKLFSYSIKDNVAGGLRGNEILVEEALEKTGLLEKVNNMPEKMDTVIYQRSKEKGVEISGGEAQKIAIARALYKDSPIVILDEPTAALDPKSEAEIYENFGRLVKNKTAIFISHRMSSCKFCDEIIVIDDGKIIEQGHHNVLLKDNGLYNQMWTAQAKYYSEA
jgi:ATP-binding cassette subfamily B protein